MTVYGSHLDSVAEPSITLTVIITRFNNDLNVSSSTQHISSEVL